MREANELVIVLCIGSETTDRNRHTVFKVSVESGLRVVVLSEIVEELLRCGGKLKLLRNALEILPDIKYLID